MAEKPEAISREELLDLIERVKSGDEEGKKKLLSFYYSYYGKINAYVRSLLRKDHIISKFPVEHLDTEQLVDDITFIAWNKLLNKIRKDPEDKGFDPEKMEVTEAFFKWIKEYIICKSQALAGQ